MKEDMFKDRVRNRRLELKMSQSELAAESGLSPGTIGDIEAGRQRGTKNIDLLATALKTTADQLRTGEQSTDIPESTLSAREVRLIERFRSMNPKNKGRLEDIATGLQGPIKDPPPSVKQTAHEICGVKSRRSGLQHQKP